MTADAVDYWADVAAWLDQSRWLVTEAQHREDFNAAMLLRIIRRHEWLLAEARWRIREVVRHADYAHHCDHTFPWETP